jgi:hypothetical protein
MQTDQTPRQPEALHPEDFAPAAPRPPQPQRRPRGFSAGECGDAIWECPAEEGETFEREEPPCDEPQPAAPETSVRAGRLIDLEGSRARREQI